MDINQILLHLKKRKTAIFLGAGISRDSGIPTADSIVKQVIFELTRSNKVSDDLYNSYKNLRMPFERFMQVVIESARDNSLLEIFDQDFPNQNHRFIAWLCWEGLVNEIYTTNFDMLLELALEEIGLTLKKDYLVFSEEQIFKQGIALSIKKDKRIRIFKIHGSIDDTETIRTTLRGISSNSLYQQRAKILNHIFCQSRYCSLLFLGYSFSDTFDVNKFLANLKTFSTKKIVLVDHSPWKRKITTKPLHNTTYNNFRFANLEGIKIEAKTFNLVKLLWASLDKSGKVAPISTCSFDWHSLLKKWVKRLHPSLREYSASRICHLLNNLDQSLRYVNIAIQKAGKFELKLYQLDARLLKTSLLHERGTTRSISSAYKIASSCAETSIRLQYLKGLSDSYHLLGLIYMTNWVDLDKAEEAFLIALNASVKLKFELGKAKEQLQLASVYRKKKQYRDAMDLYKFSLQCRTKEGDVSGIMRCYLGMGNLYFENRKLGPAKKYYMLLLQLCQQAADEWMSSFAYYALAGTYLAYGDRMSLLLAKTNCDLSINIRSRKQGSYAYLNSRFMEAELNYETAKNLSEKKTAYSQLEGILEKRKKLKLISDVTDSQLALGTNYLRDADFSKAFRYLKKAVANNQETFLIRLLNLKKVLEKIKGVLPSRFSADHRLVLDFCNHIINGAQKLN